MRRLVPLGALLALLTASGCGAAGHRAVPASAMPVLAVSAVPGIPSVTTTLTAARLAQDAPIHGLAAKIASWGYLSGRQRTFQGESRRLTLVVSRALLFRGAAGARRYAQFVRGHASAFFGTATQTRRITGQGLAGWLFVPPLCACHLASPALVGVLRAGPRVTWLAINGPAATPALLVRLLGSVRNVPGR